MIMTDKNTFNIRYAITTTLDVSKLLIFEINYHYFESQKYSLGAHKRFRKYQNRIYNVMVIIELKLRFRLHFLMKWYLLKINLAQIAKSLDQHQLNIDWSLSCWVNM